MATEVLKTFSALQDELQKAKDGLRSVDDNIKRIIGRDPEAPVPVGGPPRPGQKRQVSHLDEYHGRAWGFLGRGGRLGGPGAVSERPGGLGGFAGPGRQQEEDGPPGIRRRLGEKTIFSRLAGPPHKFVKKEEEEEEGEEDETQYKPAISSRVIPQVREQPSKEDIIKAQGDERSKARNRRMFGALLGTLQKFRQEETMMRDREDKKAQVEKKLEEAAKREKEELKKERQELFNDRRRKQQEIRRIEFKIQRVKEQDQWEARHRPLLNFIQTKTKPHIFYLPKIHNSKTEERLVASQKMIAKMMEKKRASLQEELERFDGRNQVKTDVAEPQHIEEEEEEGTEVGDNAAENTVGNEEKPVESPPENKENRLRSVNVKIEKEPEQKVTMSGKIVRPESEKKSESDRRSDQRQQHSQRDRRDHDRSKDRQNAEERHNDRERERDRSRDRGRDRERDRPRERDRNREKRSEKENKVDVKKEKEEEEKWDRKRDRDESDDVDIEPVNEPAENEELAEEPMEDSDPVVDAPELSTISLPGEVTINEEA